MWLPSRQVEFISFQHFTKTITLTSKGPIIMQTNLITVQQDVTVFSLLHFCRQLYMFWVWTLIIRSLYSCNYNFWYWLTGSTTISSHYWVGTGWTIIKFDSRCTDTCIFKKKCKRIFFTVVTGRTATNFHKNIEAGLKDQVRHLLAHYVSSSCMECTRCINVTNNRRNNHCLLAKQHK